MHLPFWLAANHLPNIYPGTFMRWLSHFCDIADLFHAPLDALLAAGVTNKQIEMMKQFDWKIIEKDLAWASQDGHHIMTIVDADYPAQLREITHPPLVLYIRGNKAALAQTQIAIVGSRHATVAGLKNAEWFATTLAECGFAITSGLALGVDARSHQGALAAKGVTIGVAGTGLEHVYPRAHKPLLEDIVCQGGAIISEFPLATSPHAFNFPRRNRVISGLSVGVLVVEAALKSGSLITARHALEQGREVFAIPGSIHHPLSRGCHHLIRQGAALVESAEDIIAELGVLLATMKPKGTKSLSVGLNLTETPAELAKEQGQILDLIGYDITPMNVILLRSGLTTDEVSSILLTLELKGYIQSVTGGYSRVVIR